MITSTRNPKIAWVRKLQGQVKARREANLFVVEGVRLAEEALAAGWPVELALYDATLSGRGREVLDAWEKQGIQVEEAAEHVLRSASDTQNPQGLLAVVAVRELPLPEPLDLVLVADGVRDPGNLGTILRTAAAAGAGAVFLPPGGVDPWSPKVVRAGMGAHFRLPVCNLSWEEIRARVKAAGLQVYLAAAGAGEPYTDCDFRRPMALIVGGEAAGAGVQAESLAGATIHIPMPGRMESLNAAVAAAVLMFEIGRQRNTAGRQRNNLSTE